MMFSNVVVSSLVLLGTSVGAQMQQPPQQSMLRRYLQTTDAKMTWPECETNNLSALDCKAYIEAQIATHAIPDIEVEVIYPYESTAEYESSYWKVGILTNHLGKVLGTEVDGKVYYPHEWEGTDPVLGTREIGPWECGYFDVSPNQCCNLIKASVPDPDINGNYIECYITQEIPQPYVKADGSYAYCEWTWNPTTATYEPTPVNYFDLVTQDTYRKTELLKNIPHYEAMLRDGVADYDTLQLIKNGCHLNGRAMESLQSLCNDLDVLMHPPNGPGSTIQVTGTFHDTLTALVTAINEYANEPFDAKHKITIYAGNADGTYVVGNPGIASHGKPNGRICVPP